MKESSKMKIKLSENDLHMAVVDHARRCATFCGRGKA
jgi:hypothetical protein